MLLSLSRSLFSSLWLLCRQADFAAGDELTVEDDGDTDVGYEEDRGLVLDGDVIEVGADGEARELLYSCALSSRACVYFFIRSRSMCSFH